MLFNESGILAGFGRQLGDNLIGGIVTCVLFAGYLHVSAIALYLICQKGLHKPPILIMFIIQISLILSSIWQAVIVNGEFLDQVFHILVDFKADTNEDLGDRMSAWESHDQVWVSMWGWPGSINLLIGDIIVVWRAWTLWEHHTAVQWILIILGICNGVVNLVDSLYITEVPAPSDNTLRLFSWNFFSRIFVSGEHSSYLVHSVQNLDTFKSYKRLGRR
ncbi:hypothetical protein BDP27DRAFT_1406323 [Rhodocollybia butyracea]|uniref:Uncharacterized protein n=1 Tax=Rhodocollybia butyracea TaxID=206335 RepID=A0A9P5PFE6_9AGAR|nr:hypothetical protein BDP27DRAFT_1406323 [Rhodocollybia butyracea]